MPDPANPEGRPPAALPASQGTARTDTALPPLDEALVRRLVAGQFPDWADLPVQAIDPQGHDNRTFRLGAGLSVRLPSALRYAGQVAKEQRWLPVLAEGLPVAIPEPVAQGHPAEGFPFDWSVYRWLPGRPASPADDLPQLATDLARVLRGLQALPASDGPAAGTQNFHRGGDLRVYDAETRPRIDRLAPQHDSSAARAIWDRALVSAWQHAPVWLHGDIAEGNLLVEDGRLSALINWGNCGTGDPSADLAIGWSLFDAPARAVFRLAFRFDDETWDRARGWALWKALSRLDEGAGPCAATCLARLLDKENGGPG